MHNIHTIFLCLLFATQISAMEPSQNSNKDITIPRQVETLFKLAAQCIAKHLKTYKEEQIICLSKEIKKELARQHYLISDKYILGFEEEDFTFSLAELINHGKITISSNQLGLNLRAMKIHIIHSFTLQKIANECSFPIFLDLAHNQISKLPDSIEPLTKIKNLYLDHNIISKLPNFMSKLVRLEYLSFSNNHLTEPLDSIGKLTKLRELYLYNNQISKIPSSMSKLVNLKELNLCNNRLSQKEQEKTCALLPNTNVCLGNQQEDSHA